MLIANWMTPDPLSVRATASLAKCQKMLKTNKIRRVPVVDEENRVIGIISDRDVKSASPSKATSLEVHEVQYLLAEVKAKDIMTPEPITVKSTDTISDAALIMLDKKIGGLPVVDENKHLVGIITDQDIFEVLITISGARIAGIDITIETTGQPGSLQAVFEMLRTYKARIISVMTAYQDSGLRHVFIRVRRFGEEGAEAQLLTALKEKVKVLEWTVQPDRQIADK